MHPGGRASQFSLSTYAGTPFRVQFYIHIPTPGIASLDLGLQAIMPPAYEQESPAYNVSHMRNFTYTSLKIH